MSRERLFVELNCGDTPLPLRGSMDFRHDTTYLGLTKKLGTLAGKDSAWRKIENSDRIHASIVQVTDEELPFGNNQVSEIFMADGVGSKISEQHMRILKEAHRVLVPQGRLIILETIAPPNINSIIKLLEDTHFTPGENGLVAGTDSKWQETVNPYFRNAPTRAQSMLPSFIVFASQKMQPNPKRVA